MKMSKFFVKCGKMTSHEVIISGDFPKKMITSHWTYANGEAWFDGTTWTFKLNKE
jgi:hypothetical protein